MSTSVAWSPNQRLNEQIAEQIEGWAEAFGPMTRAQAHVWSTICVAIELVGRSIQVQEISRAAGLGEGDDETDAFWFAARDHVNGAVPAFRALLDGDEEPVP